MQWLTPAVLRALGQLLAAIVALLLALGVLHPEAAHAVLDVLKQFGSNSSLQPLIP